MALSSPDYSLWGCLKEKLVAEVRTQLTYYSICSAWQLPKKFVLFLASPWDQHTSHQTFFVCVCVCVWCVCVYVCVCVCVCVCALCNDAVNIWDCRAEWAVDWWMINRRELRRKWSWLFVVLLYWSACLEELRKNTQILCQDIRCLGWNSDPAS